jgi:prophage antirepressor-like protein
MSIINMPSIYDGHQLSIIIIGNERWLRSSQIGLALGYSFPQQSMNRIFKRNGSEFGVEDTMLVELPTDSGPQLTRLFSDKGIAKIAMLASTPKAAAFRDWAAQMLTAPKPELLLTSPFSATARSELRKAWLAYGKNRKFLKYQMAGLSMAEIMLLCGWTHSSTVSAKRRAAEDLGLIQPSPHLALYRRKAIANGRIGRSA